jgi:hypothetical protein
MAEPAVPIPPSPKDGKKGGMLKNLNPKQKRIAAVVGVGALLAVIFLIARRKSAPEEEGQTPSDSSEAEGGSSGIVPGSGGATDPSAFLGEFSERQNEALERFGEQIGEGLGRLETGRESSPAPSNPGDLTGAAIAPAGAAAAVGNKKVAAKAKQGTKPGQNQRAAGGKNAGGTTKSGGGSAHPPTKQTGPGSKKLPQVKLGGAGVAAPAPRPAAPAPAPVTGGGGGVAQVGGAGGASGGVVHPNAYSSGIGAGHPKPAPPAGYHTYQGANGQWWFAPN